MDNSNISGSNGSLLNSIPSIGNQANGTTGSPQTKASAGISEASFQVFSDALENGQTIIQQFLPTNLRGVNTVYQADPHNPMLTPPDPDGGTAPTPFEPSWQRAVNKFFREQLREALTKEKVHEKGTSASHQDLSGDELANIETEVNRIMLAVGENRGKNLSKEEQAIAAETTKKTQEAWALPSSWSLGKKTTASWTPIRSDVIPPVNIEASRRQEVGSNVVQLGEDIEAVGKKVANEFPPDDPNRIAVKELILVLTKALSDLKKVLQIIQVQDAKVSENIFAAKYDAIEQKMDDLQKQIKQQKEMQSKQEKGAKKQKEMKVITLVASVAIAVVGVVIIAASAGTLTPLVIASVVMATAMIGYAAADYKEGYTQDMMVGFDNWLAATFPDSKTREAMKAIILAIAILVLIIAASSAGAQAGAQAGTTTATAAAAQTGATAGTTAGAAAGAQAAATAGTTTATTYSTSIATRVIAEMLKQGTMQFTMMFIMTSNIAPELAVNAMIASGAIDKDDEEAQMIVQIIVMVMTMLLTMGIMAKGFQNSMDPEAATAGLNNTASETKGMIDQTLRNSPKIIQERMESSLIILEGVLKLGTATVQTVGNIQIGLMGLQLEKLLREMGDNEKALELHQQLIKFFEQLLASFQKGSTESAQWINDLNRAIDSAFGNASLSLTKATQQAMA